MKNKAKSLILRLLGMSSAPDYNKLKEFSSHLFLSLSDFQSVVNYGNSYVFGGGLDEKIRNRNQDILKSRLVVIYEELHDLWAKVDWSQHPDLDRPSHHLVGSIHRLLRDPGNGQLFITRSSVILGLYDSLILRINSRINSGRSSSY